MNIKTILYLSLFWRSLLNRQSGKACLCFKTRRASPCNQMNLIRHRSLIPEIFDAKLQFLKGSLTLIFIDWFLGIQSIKKTVWHNPNIKSWQDQNSKNIKKIRVSLAGRKTNHMWEFDEKCGSKSQPQHQQTSRHPDNKHVLTFSKLNTQY